MRVLTSVLCLCLSLSVLWSSPALAAPVSQTLDQQNLAGDSTLSFLPVFANAPEYQYFGQTFTAGKTGLLTQVTVAVQAPAGTTLDLYVRPFSMTNGADTAAISANAETTTADATGTCGSDTQPLVTFTFATPAHVDAGSAYVLQVSADSIDAAACSASSDVYAGGEAALIFNDGPASAALPPPSDAGIVLFIDTSASDLVFQTFVNVVPEINAADVAATATSAAGSHVYYPPVTASDDNGPLPADCSPASQSLFPLGPTTVTCSATDDAGQTGTGSFTVDVTYDWSGILGPARPGGRSVHRSGIALPLRFRLTGASAGITDATAKLYFSPLINGVAGSPQPAVSIDKATVDNLFRYDQKSGDYVFNWSTAGLTRGSYRLSIDLGDGVTRTLDVELS